MQNHIKAICGGAEGGKGIKLLSKKNYDHQMKAAGRTYRELQRVEAELERVKHERDLERACAAGFSNMAARLEKEAEFYKNMYERERIKNEKLEKDLRFDRSNYCHFRVVPCRPRFRLP